MERGRGLSDKEQSLIREAMAKGMSPYAVKLPGRSHSTAWAWAVRHGLHIPINDRLPWSPEQDAAIQEGYYTDGSRSVAQKLGRTRNEVIGRANTLKKRGLLKRIY